MDHSASVSTHQHDAAVSSTSQRAGSPEKLAEAIGVNLGKVAEWIGGCDVSADVCPAIEHATSIRCDELRPDLVWVRNATDEVLGYVVPVDGADAKLVRQALAGMQTDSAPASMRSASVDMSDGIIAKTDLFEGFAQVYTLKNGTVVYRANSLETPLDLAEAALLAETILNHRERAVCGLPHDQWLVAAEFPYPLMPITFERGEGGVHASEIHVAGWEGGIAVRAGGAGMQDGERILEVCRQTGTRASVTLSVRMSRKEADTLAFALNGGNDGSTVASAARVLCADVAEAIAVIERGELPFVKNDDLRQSLIGKRNAVLDLCEGFDNHVMLRHGNLRQGRLPPRDAIDRLAEAADHARQVMSLHRGRLLAEGWKNDRGESAADRGFYADMREAEKRLSSAAIGVEFRSDPPNVEPPKVEVKAAPFRDPLEATAKSTRHGADKKRMRIVNTKWELADDATVENCLEDAEAATASIQRIMESGMYDDFEDTIWMWNTVARTCLSDVLDKLTQFRAEGMRS